MRGKYNIKLLVPLVAALLGVGMTAGPSIAAEYWLCAKSFDMAMPDSTTVPMWGFALSNTDFSDNCAGTATVPGPKLIVPTGDSTLTVNLRNDLAGPGIEPISVVIPGQAMPVVGSGPVFDGDRVRSFVQEAATGGGIQTYTWNDLQPGSYLYQSGTHPQVQVQMGLYGALTKDNTTGMAYPGVAYTEERDLFYSEVAPDLHIAVATGAYGTPPWTSTLNYFPKYFLLHGYDMATNLPFDVSIDTGMLPSPTCIDSGIGQGDRLLLRLYNAGLRELAPMLLGAHFDLVAEGGNPYPFARTQYQTLLMPGSTKDAVFTPTYQDNFKLIERRLNLTDAAMSGGGMQTCIMVAGVTNNTPVVTITQPASDSDLDGVITFEGSVTDAEDDNAALTAALAWNSSLDGAFTNSGGGPFDETLSVGTHIVTASVTDSGGVTGSATRTITVGVTVPTVEGMSQTDAASLINGTTGLSVGSVTTQNSDTVPLDDVISQNPAGGAVVASGSSVDLVVSLGPAGPVNTAPVVTIDNPSNGATFTQIDSTPFNATANDVEEGDITTTATWRWTSDRDGEIGTTASFTRTLSIGTHTIRAFATDSGVPPLEGASDPITIVINAAASDTLTCKKADYKAGPDSLTIEVKSDDLPKGNRTITGVVGDGTPFNIPVKNPGSDVYRTVIQPYPGTADPTGLPFTATSDLGGTCTIPVN